VIKHLRYGAVSVPPQYEEDFKKAIWAFKFQRVYDPATEDIIHLSSVPQSLIEDLEFLGPYPLLSLCLDVKALSYEVIHCSR
jgi:exonuclease 1